MNKTNSMDLLYTSDISSYSLDELSDMHERIHFWDQSSFKYLQMTLTTNQNDIHDEISEWASEWAVTEFDSVHSHKRARRHTL